MTSVNEKAYAKINISLDVTGKRPDGYHDMLMVMQTITLCDDITVALTPGEASRAECNLRFVPCDERNLAVRAANAFFAHCGIENMGAHIKMQKRIPVGAGMAGGSSDAAAVLRALNVLCKTGLNGAALEKIAAEIGCCVLRERRNSACLGARRDTFRPAADARLRGRRLQARFFRVNAGAVQAA